MKTILTVLLYLHIAGGTLTLIAAPVAIVLRNTTPRHRLAGRVYFYSMMLVAATALAIAAYKNIPFLFLVAIFSFYAIWDARRALALKMLHKGQKPKWYDWAVGILTLVFDMGLLAYGILLITKGNATGWIALVFGVIGTVSVWQSLGRFVKLPVDANHWLYRHISGMMAGYIATVTAFMAVNVKFLPAMVVWLLPTVIGSVYIAVLIRNVKKLGPPEKAL